MANIGLGLDGVELHVPITEAERETAQELKTVLEDDVDIPVECELTDGTLVADLTECEPNVSIWEVPEEETYRSEREREPRPWLEDLWENDVEYLECASLSVPRDESGARAQELFHSLGVTFDTGGTVGGGMQDWELDFSLKGASVHFID